MTTPLGLYYMGLWERVEVSFNCQARPMMIEPTNMQIVYIGVGEAMWVPRLAQAARRKIRAGGNFILSR
jgi:hypothetical protein